MKKKYISIILVTLMALTPLQAAASSDFAEDWDSAAYQEGNGGENDAAFSGSDQYAPEKQAVSEEQPASDEQFSSEEQFSSDEQFSSEEQFTSKEQFTSEEHLISEEQLASEEQPVSEGQPALSEQADFAALPEEYASSQDAFDTDYFNPDSYGSDIYGFDSYGSDYFGSAGSDEDGGSAGTEVQFGENAIWNAEFAENDLHSDDNSSLAGITGVDMAADTGAGTGGESESQKSESGDSEAGKSADGINADAPDELLTDKKNGSSEAGAGDSVLTTGSTALTDGTTSSVMANGEQSEENFPQSGTYGSFKWKVEEIKPDEDSEGSSEENGDNASESTGNGSKFPLKLTIEGNGGLLFPMRFPGTVGILFEENESVMSFTETGSEIGSGTGTENETGGVTGDVTGTETEKTGGSGTVAENDPETEERAVFPWDCWKERITQIILGEGVTEIGEKAFSGYIELEMIRFPKSVSGVTSIATDAFDGSATDFTICGAFDSFAETYARKYGYPFIGIINGKIGENLEWELAGKRDNLDLTISGSGSMAGISSWPWDGYRDSIIKVQIDKNVTDIGESAFESCIQLTEVKLGASVQEIGRYAFRDCSRLKSVEFPKLLLRIGAAAFSGCVSLEKLDFPEEANLLSIETSAFSDCISLVSVIIPDKVSTLGSYSFYRCIGLKNITLPDGITAIEKKTFSGCTQLANITLPANTETIGEEAFSGCTELTEVSAEGSWLQKIRTKAFMGCTRLESISVPGCLLEVGKSAFELCSSLKKIILPDGVKSVESRAFYNCRNLASVSLPESITSVGDWAFYNCSVLGKLIFPKHLRSVGKWAFAGCWDIKELNIPDSVEELGSYAFLDCRSLKVIETTSNLKKFGNYVFVGCADDCVMYGVRGSAAHKYAKDNDITFIDRRYDLSNAVVTGIETKVWKKGGVTQNPKVTFNGITLKEGTDYTLSYRKNRDVGRAEVRINSAGNYDGYYSRTFKINPKQVSDLKLTAGSKEFKATWKEETGETLSGYELQYSTSSSFKNDTVTLTIGKASTPWKRVTKLKAGITYYVRVRAFRKKGSNEYRSKWSEVKKVKTLK